MHHCAAGPFFSSAGQLAITVSGGEARWGRPAPEIDGRPQ